MSVLPTAPVWRCTLAGTTGRACPVERCVPAGGSTSQVPYIVTAAREAAKINQKITAGTHGRQLGAVREAVPSPFALCSAAASVGTQL